LLILRDLDNHDKHHLQATALVQPATLQHASSVEFESKEDADRSVPPDVEIFGPDFRDGEVLLCQRTGGRIAHVKGGFNISAQVQVVLPDGRQYGVTHLLAGLCVYTRQILEYIGAVAGA
jgi:hypothetical protein